MNFFSRFNRITTVAYSGVLISAALLFGSLYQESKVSFLNSLQLQLIEQTQALNFILRVRADAVKAMKMEAEDFLEESSGNLFKPSLIQESPDGFSLNPQAMGQKDAGKLTGKGIIEKLSPDHWHEIMVAYRLNSLFKIIKKNTQTILFAYYISAQDFSNVYPAILTQIPHFCINGVKGDSCLEISGKMFGNDRLYWSDTYLNSENLLALTCAAPVYQEGKFKGIVGIDFTLDAINHFFDYVRHQYGRLFIVNEYASVLEDTGVYEEAVEENIKLKVYGTLPPELTIDKIKQLKAHKISKLENYWVYQSPTAYAPWTLIYYISSIDVLLATFRDIGPGFILIFLFATIILIAANRLIAQEFIDPTEKLIHHIANQGKLKIPYKELKDPWLTWFEAVSKVFQENRNLVSKLEEHISDLDQEVLKRTKDLSKRNKQLQGAINNLEKAQYQIVLQEKMAGLGALTAGIAHEIKNPLNFVINFSETSRMFLSDLQHLSKNLKKKINTEEYQEIKQLIEDLTMNIERIEKHGKHADTIIHSMLVHARGGSDEPQEIKINDLIEENLLLVISSFKQKGFNPIIERNYEKKPTKSRVFPQDLGRALLNVLTNACDALYEKSKKRKFFKPLLKITTSNLPDCIDIKIFDNGPGMSEKVVKRIFDPFFTTKTSGKGTGLGLSLSYDVITQQHQGLLTVNSKEGEYTEFHIILPKGKILKSSLKS
jgi:signal transduction histidine kinase